MMNKIEWNKKGFTGMLAAAIITAGVSGSTMFVYADEAAAAGVDMSTDYPGITVKAGQSVSFSLDFVSEDGEGHEVSLNAESLPENWSGYFKGKSNEVSKIYVSGATTETPKDGDGLATYNLDIPADTADGTYTVELLAVSDDGKKDKLNLEVTVNEMENGASEMTVTYAEQQGATGSSFSFATTIVNNRGTGESFALSAQAPEGWAVTFTPSSESANVSSIDVEAGESSAMTVKIVPPTTVAKGDYVIPISAISADDTLSTDLTVSITGTYAVELTTPDGRLSFDAYANKESSVTLVVNNNGNVDLTNLNLSSSVPTGWEVTFSESSIDTLEAGASKEITATIKPGEDVITGDYVNSISISNNETGADAAFRVSVKTPTTWGYAAVAIIAAILVILVLIFKKYGRR